MNYHVFSFISGIPVHQGEFYTFDEAKTLQKKLHKEGFYYVPVLSTEQARAEKFFVEIPSRAVEI